MELWPNRQGENKAGGSERQIEKMERILPKNLFEKSLTSRQNHVTFTPFDRVVIIKDCLRLSLHNHHNGDTSHRWFFWIPNAISIDLYETSLFY